MSNKLTAYRLRLGLVRDHARDAVLVGLADHLRHIALALTLGRLGGQDVALKRLTALYLAGSRLFETLGGPGVCLHFWHVLPSDEALSNQQSAFSQPPQADA